MSKLDNFMDDLLSKKCIPCEGGELPLTRKQAEIMMAQIPGWTLESDTVVSREFTFKDFKSVMVFVNKVADVAEVEGHHPDILVHGWKHIKISLTTHAIKGLSGNDFIMAAKITEVHKKLTP